MRQGIEVTYIYSACVVITTPDCRVLCDPWFTEGVYDGAWYHFPEVANPSSLIGDVDFIYISHIHPDHYDPAFLQEYIAGREHPPKLLIGARQSNILQMKMKQDGFAPQVLETELRTGATSLRIVPHETGSASDIDTALLVAWQGDERVHRVANTNDVVVDDGFLEAFDAAAEGPVDILLCGYTGAGPYPQTYFDADDPALRAAADAKKQAFFARYQRLTRHIGARANIPFAGKYLLGGRLAHLNAWRGVADATEVLTFDADALVLADAGGTVATDDLTRADTRTEPYADSELESRIAGISKRPLAYEAMFASNFPTQNLPIHRLMRIALRNALERSEVGIDHYFLINWEDGTALFNARRGSDVHLLDQATPLPTPRSEIRIDPRYLFGLLTHVFHWNNAEVGSQFQTRRYPDEFVRSAQQFLNYLAV